MFSATDKIGAEVDLLVHRADAGALRASGVDVARMDWPFKRISPWSAGYTPVSTDEGGLARAVLAHEGVHFTGKQAQVHACEGPHGAELLGHAGKLKHGCSDIAGRWCVCHGVL